MARVTLHGSLPCSQAAEWVQGALAWIYNLAAKHGGVTVSSCTFMPASVLRVSGPSRTVPRDVTPALPPPRSAPGTAVPLPAETPAPLAKQPQQFS